MRGDCVRTPACVLSRRCFSLTCVLTPWMHQLIGLFFLIIDLMIILIVLHLKNMYFIIMVCTSIKAERDSTASWNFTVMEWILKAVSVQFVLKYSFIKKKFFKKNKIQWKKIILSQWHLCSHQWSAVWYLLHEDREISTKPLH